jgi:hypothetical protein
MNVFSRLAPILRFALTEFGPLIVFRALALTLGTQAVLYFWLGLILPLTQAMALRSVVGSVSLGLSAKRALKLQIRTVASG